ncbi:MAG TPA: IPT/TIG domain-containing protein [Bacteroidia bacterium]|nr:IPT/TIG domain-containing protein [Bacteroidia bacterium]HNU33202.1 IPT/TIG domain-containing protein [Bacteroidia bacterium]
MIRKALIPSIIVAGVIINSCKKIDPDCSTCPCPACPRITEVLPNHGRPGDTLILKGINFNVDPYLNLITFNDTLVQEILDGTTTELKVIVPEGTTTGSVKIKINDDKALSSDEIPDFTEPVFTIDHFVELVAGTPEVQGDGDGLNNAATFCNLSKIAVDDIYNKIYLIDKVQSNNNKTIREIDSLNVTTVFTSSSNSTQYQLNDLTSTYDIAYYVIENNPPNNSNAIKYKNINGTGLFSFLLANFPTYRFSQLCIDTEQAHLFYLMYKNTGYNYYLMRRKLMCTNSCIDTIKYFGNSSTVGVDLEFNKGEFYYAKYNSATLTYSICKLVSVSGNYQEQVIINNLTYVSGIAIDRNKNVYFSKDNQIFRVLSNGQSQLIAGAILPDYNFDPATGLNSFFNSIKDIDFDSNNNLYIVDAGNYCIRRLKID